MKHAQTWNDYITHTMKCYTNIHNDLGYYTRAFDLLRRVQNQSLVMVVSPLVGLMSDQAASFASKGFTAACISDEDDHHSTKLTRRGIKSGDFQLIFVSPEALFATLE